MQRAARNADRILNSTGPSAGASLNTLRHLKPYERKIPVRGGTGPSNGASLAMTRCAGSGKAPLTKSVFMNSCNGMPSANWSDAGTLRAGAGFRSASISTPRSASILGGADAWMGQGAMLGGLSVGAPPDQFNPAGQDWGLTAYNPHRLAASQFGPFRQMLRAAMRYAGAVRLDHVLGLMRLFVIPRGMPAHQGAYLRLPFTDLLAVVAEESRFWNCIVIGEDLGTVPENFRATLGAWGVWSYLVMLFERNWGGSFKPPTDYPDRAIATFNTHDLPTFAGWMGGHDLQTKRAIGVDPGESDDERQGSRAALNAALPIRHRLAADLHEPDDRHEHADEPEPADAKIRPAAGEVEHPRGHSREEQGRGDDFCDRPGAVKRIERRQIRRPEEADEVAGVRDDGVADAQAQRHLFKRRHRAVAALRDDRHDAHADGEREEGDFLDEEEWDGLRGRVFIRADRLGSEPARPP